MSQKISIMLVDDHVVVRAGVGRLLEQYPAYEVIAEAESGEKAYQLFGEIKPDVLIIDLSMPGIGGLEAIRRILMRYPKANILVLSMHENLSFANQAMKLGAKGYIIKSSLADELIQAIESVSKGNIYLSEELAEQVALQSSNPKNDPVHDLSAREFEIFRLLAEGKEIDYIAKTLNISVKTVSNYQTAIKQKLGVHNAIELIRYALRVGAIKN